MTSFHCSLKAQESFLKLDSLVTIDYSWLPERQNTPSGVSGYDYNDTDSILVNVSANQVVKITRLMISSNGLKYSTYLTGYNLDHFTLQIENLILLGKNDFQEMGEVLFADLLPQINLTHQSNLILNVDARIPNSQLRIDWRIELQYFSYE